MTGEECSHNWRRTTHVNELGDGKHLLWDKCGNCKEMRFVLAEATLSEGTT